MTYQWQPIETAPKDGTDVLLFGMCEWCDYGSRKDKPRTIVGYYREDDGLCGSNWFSSTHNPYEDTVHATHWMPLPEPPHSADNNSATTTETEQQS